MQIKLKIKRLIWFVSFVFIYCKINLKYLIQNQVHFKLIYGIEIYNIGWNLNSSDHRWLPGWNYWWLFVVCVPNIQNIHMIFIKHLMYMYI